MKLPVDPTKTWALKTAKKHITDGCSPNTVNKKTGLSILSIAVCSGEDALVQTLLDAGADPTNHAGDESLIIAASQGYTSIVEALLFTDIEIGKVDGEGATALTYAAAGGYLKIVEILLEAGADPRHKDRDGKRPIIYAAERGHRKTIKLLIPYAASADKKEIDFFLGLNKPKSLAKEQRLFLNSVESGDVSAVRAYLEAGGNANITYQSGLGAIRYAMGNSDFVMLDALINGGVDVNRLDNEGECPLHYAVEGGSEKLYQYLLPMTSEELRTKVIHRREEIIEQEQWTWDRPDIDERYQKQRLEKKEENDRLFNMAKTSLWPDVEPMLLQMLQENPKLAHIIKPDGSTMLMMAVKSNNPRLVKYLIEKCDANPNQTNAYGHCALREARHQPGLRNPKQRLGIYEYLYHLTDKTLRKLVEKTIAKEERKGDS